jgi:hypothetical protein
MNKLDFLRRLDRELSALDQTERRELLAFYEERFYTGTIYENKTEEQVVAELESPEAIARNILSEYGISAREARQYRPEPKPQRRVQNGQDSINNNNNNNSNNNYQEPPRRNPNSINTGKLIGLLFADIFILSWAIPTMFSVLVSVAGSLLSYVGVLGFLASDLVYDQMIFWFLTGAYVWLFIFTLAILEFFIWTVKKTVLWHMKVLKYKKVNTWNKRLAKYSVEGWFKRHKFIRFVKNVAGVAAIVVMAYTGLYLYGSYDEIKELYIDQEVITDVQRLDVTNDLVAEEVWNIIADIDSANVSVIPTTSDDIIVTRTYNEESEATYVVGFNEDTNTVDITHDMPNQIIHFGLSIEDIFSFIQSEEVVIEVPMELYLQVINIESSNGQVEIYNIEGNEVYVDGSNGKITLSNLTLDGDATIESSNAVMEVKDVTGSGELYVKTSNGKIIISDTAFDTYYLKTSNGRITLRRLNDQNQDGVSLRAESSNGPLDFEEVYVAEVIARTSNGSIDYHNEDLTFEVDYDGSTSNGSESVNVD